MKWWEITGRGGRPKIEKSSLEGNVPRPGDSKGHVLPYVKDDWKTIEAIKRGANPHLMIIKLSCLGCGVKHEAIIPKALMDKDGYKWLCSDCIDERGFAWSSALSPAELTHYQLVKVYKDDTLVRRLDKSPNYKDPMHDPYDPDSNRKKVL